MIVKEIKTSFGLNIRNTYCNFPLQQPKLFDADITYFILICTTLSLSLKGSTMLIVGKGTDFLLKSAMFFVKYGSFSIFKYLAGWSKNRPKPVQRASRKQEKVKSI